MSSVQRHSVRDQIRRTLTERILSGEYKPGYRLIELQIAREFGVSQGSVREALRELEASYLVESEPNRGTRVRVVGMRDLRDAYFVRGTLEQAAAPAAAKKFKGDAGELRRICDAMIAAATVGDFAEQAANNRLFHRMIVEAADNRILLRMWDSLAFETRTRIRLAIRDIDPVESAHTHWPIVEALEKGNAATVGRLLREHAERFAPTEEDCVGEQATPEE